MKTNYPPRQEPWKPHHVPRPALQLRNIVIPNVTGSPTSETEGSTTEEIYRREWTGVSTLNFGAFKKQRLPVNPHHVYILETDPGFSSRREVWISPGNPNDSSHRYGSYVWTNGAGSGVPPLAEHMLSCRDVAIKRLQALVTSNSNLALDLLEVNQFIRMVKNTAARLTGSVRALRRGNIPGAITALWQGKKPRFRKGGGPSVKKGLADNWLELQYGWKPLLQDIKGSAENLARLQLDDRVVCQIKSSAKIVSSSKEPILFNSKVVGNRLWDRTTHIKFGMRYKVDSALGAFISQSGFTNPLNLAWEVLPFSFVVDWFIGVGPYLESLNSWDGLTFLDGYETRFTRENFRSSYMWSMWLSSAHADGGSGFTRSNAIRLDRIKLTSFPSLRPPSFKNPFSTQHALNALALLKVTFLRS